MPGELSTFGVGGGSSFSAWLAGGTRETGDFSAGIWPEDAGRVATNAAGVSEGALLKVGFSGEIA
jgi:hypothetical protein